MDKNFDDMQNMTNANTGAAMRSFNAVTKSTQAIAIEIADYSKRSFEHSAKAMENFLGVKSLICKGGLRIMSHTQPSWANSTPIWPRKPSSRTRALSVK